MAISPLESWAARAEHLRSLDLIEPRPGFGLRGWVASEARIIAAARAADDQIRALQEIVIADRK